MFSLFSSSDNHPVHKSVIWRVDAAGVSVIIINDTTNQMDYYDHYTISASLIDGRHYIDQLYTEITTAIHRLAERLVEQFPHFPKQTTVILGEPWSHMVKRKVTYKRGTEFKVTHTILREIISRDMKKMLTENTYKKIAEHSTFTAPEIQSVSIGGHQVVDYIGKKVQDIRIEYTTGFFDHEVVSIITESINQKAKVPLSHITWKHYHDSFIQFWNQKNTGNSIIIDPSGLVTELAIFQNNSLVQWGTIPVGLLSLKNSIARDLSLSTVELTTLLSLYSKGLLDDAVIRKLHVVFNNNFEAWEHDFQSFCSHAIENGNIIDQVVWFESSLDGMGMLAVQAIKSNSAAFPLIFGSHQTGFVGVNTFFNSTVDVSEIPAADALVISELLES